jgi:hypothetical protein
MMNLQGRIGGDSELSPRGMEVCTSVLVLSPLYVRILQRDFKILSFEAAIQLCCGMSVVLLRCPLVPEIMKEGATEVCLPQTVTLKLTYMTYSMLMRC